MTDISQKQGGWTPGRPGAPKGNDRWEVVGPVGYYLYLKRPVPAQQQKGEG